MWGCEGQASLSGGAEVAGARVPCCGAAAGVGGGGEADAEGGASPRSCLPQHRGLAGRDPGGAARLSSGRSRLVAPGHGWLNGEGLQNPDILSRSRTLLKSEKWSF